MKELSIGESMSFKYLATLAFIQNYNKSFLCRITGHELFL